ncbi:MAG: DUF2157 domain-containing protein [Synergistaceae bacterium]|jgi:uncharacterized membrane protein|nr:DUF2157 domain-containing protein [Synergistaceae bacterium]
MEHKISEATRRFLSDESRSWVDEGLISEGQRDGILQSYVVTKRLPVVILALGIVMIGIGVLSFIAANWDVLPPWLKIVIIVGSYLGTAAAAYCFERRGRKLAAELLLLLSGFLLLGGLALIAQVFHIQGRATDLLWTWLLVYAPTFLLVRSLPVYLLYEITGVVYINLLYADTAYRFRDPRFSFDVRTLFLPYQPLLVMIVLVAAAWWVWYDEHKFAGRGEESRLKRFFVGGADRRIFFSNFVILNWFTWICVMNSTGRTVLPFVFGVLLIGAGITVMAWKLDAFELDWQGLLCIGACGIALSYPKIWEIRSYADDRIFEAFLSSVLFGAYLVYRVIRRQRNGGFAVFLFCLLLTRWYFDMFYSFTSKSFFFTLGGLLLLLLASVYRRWSKKLEREERGKIAGGGDND